jgi:WD40 repeat protein
VGLIGGWRWWATLRQPPPWSRGPGPATTPPFAAPPFGPHPGGPQASPRPAPEDDPYDFMNARHIERVVLAPDGQTMATVDTKRSLILWRWDAKTRQLKRGPEAKTNLYAWALAISPDDKIVATGGVHIDDARGQKTRPMSTGEAQLWDARNARLLKTLETKNAVFALAFSPDGRWLAGANFEAGLSVWDVASGALRQSIRTLPGNITAVAFAPRGGWLAAGSERGTIGLWDATGDPVTGWKLRRTLSFAGSGVSGSGLPAAGWRSMVGGLAFTPDGRTLAASGRESSNLPLHVWDVPGGKLLRTVPGNGWSGVAFSPDGQTLAAGTFHGSVSFLHQPRQSALHGEMPQELQTNSSVHNLVFLPDGKTVVLANSGVRPTFRPVPKPIKLETSMTRR